MRLTFKTIDIAPLVLGCLSIFNLSHCYVLKLGWGQLDILHRRRPISDVLKDSATPEEVKKKLLFVEEVRDFAKNQIGLKVNNTYQKYSQLERSNLAWNVIASKKFAFEAKTWWFPIVGTVPYIGFFSREEAEAKANQLEQEGWDVRVQTVAAYSTLGWFDDPLISTQLAYSKWYLAKLIIHECSHATLWFSGDVSFNESFASFVGNQGALEFYRQHYGQLTYQEKLKLIKARQKLTRILVNYTQRLDKLYTSYKLHDNQHLIKDEILKKKMNILTKLDKILQAHYKSKDKPHPKRLLNNADLLSYQRYHSGSSYFMQVFQKCKQQWACFLTKMAELGSLSVKQRKQLLNTP